MAKPRLEGLPATGYLRQFQIIGDPGVTPEQAAANRARGKGPVRPRPAVKPLVPISASGLWARVKRGDFPKPTKLSARVTAWDARAVREWMDARSETPA